MIDERVLARELVTREWVTPERMKDEILTRVMDPASAGLLPLLVERGWLSSARADDILAEIRGHERSAGDDSRPSCYAPPGEVRRASDDSRILLAPISAGPGGASPTRDETARPPSAA